MWVTTRHKPDKDLLDIVKAWCQRIDGKYVERKSDSIQTLMDKYEMDRLLVLSEDQHRLYIRGNKQPYFFHPGMSVLRIKGILKGDNDVMVQIAELREGDAFLDCTLGLASDAITAAYIVGEKGRVVGVESERVIAELTKDGLSRWHQEDIPHFNEALRRIEVVCADHLDYLRQLPSNSFDVVYFDPMFRKPVTSSVGITPLRDFANAHALKEETITEALRVCRRKVMMKERSESPEFERLGFKKIVRPNASTTFGVIEK